MRIIGLDTETSGLDPWRDRLLMVQTWEGRSGKVTTKLKDWLKLKNDLENPKVVKIIHSSEFDVPFIYAHTGIATTNIWDTKLIESVILGIGMQENRSTSDDPKWSTSLKHTLKRRGIADIDKDVRETFIGHTGPLSKEQIEYGLDDVKYLEQLMKQQIEDLQELDLVEVADLENNCAEVVAWMRIHGIRLNKKKWIQIAKDTESKYNELKESLPAHVSWTSPAQVKKFFGRKGIIINSYSDFWTTTGEIKKEWIGVNPILDRFLQMQKLYKAVTSYGMGWLTNKWGYDTVHPDGRVRANFNQIVDTGRFSCYNPNLQQLPSKLQHRTAFEAEPGWELCIGDYTGQELGIMAVGAKEQDWIDAMIKGHDVHSVMGAKLIGESNWNKMAEKDCKFPFKCKCPKHLAERRPVKDLNFGLAYGKGAAALAEDMGLTVEQASNKIRNYKKVIPAITRWLNKNGNYGVTFSEAYTLPPFNRRRRLLESEEWRRRNQGKNTPVQGTGGDILKLALVKMFQYIRKNKLQDKVRILLCIHDEIITEVRIDYKKKWQKEMKSIMEEASTYVTVQPVIKTDPFLSKNWPLKD